MPINLDMLITTFGQAVNTWDAQPEAGVLVRARFADACREKGVRPVSEPTFQSGWDALDDEHKKRFCVLVSGLDREEAAELLPDHCRDGHADPAFTLFQGLTTRLNLLTLDVLQQSDVRLEEFARHFCSAWGLPIKGEQQKASAARLREIDFGRLMEEAAAARSSAEERLAYLRELQEQEEQTRRPRRGKW